MKLLFGFAVIALGSSVLLARGPLSGKREMRLNVKKGQIWVYKLAVQRPDPARSGEMTNEFKVTSVANGIITMEARVVGLKQGGKDKSKELKEILGDSKAIVPFTDLGRRTGTLIPLQFKQTKDENATLLLGEAGLYSGYFEPQPVKVGDSWTGSVTATGGCTSATFTVKTLRGNLADFEITDIAMIRHRQIGPMKMTIDLDSGMPTYMEYQVENKKSGLQSKFVETLVSVTPSR